MQWKFTNNVTQIYCLRNLRGEMIMVKDDLLVI